MKASQRFAAWVTSSGMSRAQIADLLKASPSAVTRWCDGDRVPLRKSARDIEFLTKGAIKASDWGYVETGSRGARLLQRFMTENGLSLRLASQLLGVGRTTVQTWISGTSVPNEDSLRILQRIFKVKLSPKDF